MTKLTINPRINAETFFEFVTTWPKTMLILSLLTIAGLASFMPRIHKDTSSDAFIAADDPVILYRERVRDIFGLEDPIVVAVVNDGPEGIFNPASLALVDRLTRAIAKLPNVDPDRVTSLATESNIVGTFDGMEVSDFFEPYPSTQTRADEIRAAIADFPLYQGSLVARDGNATLIVAELLDQESAQSTYDEILAVVAATSLSEGDEVHVAGEGAISGYLATYIDRDATRLNPLAAVVITIVLWVAFRTVAGAMLPNIIVLGTLAATFGSMAAFGVSFYVITNGLATILIGIAVADSIHIMSQVYEERARDPGVAHTREGRRRIARRAMTRMWKPITLTTITTIAGFTGLWLGAAMPPMKFFGLFAAVGVAAAWIYSIFFLPAALTLFPMKGSKLFDTSNVRDRYGASLKRVGAAALRRPGLTLTIAAVIALAGIAGTSRVIVQEAQIENFQTDEPIYIADKEINRRMDGTYFLDIVVETDEPEALFRPDHLRRIEALQTFVEQFPAVRGSTSVVDYIKQMHKAVNENQDEFYSIPDDEFLVAQLFLLYSASGEPDDFEEEIDTDYSQANVRFNLHVADYRLLTEIVPIIQAYVDQEFNNDEIRANLSGRVMVNYTWLKTIGDNHVRSLLLSLLFVWIAAAVVFRSILAGTLALIPVGMALLLVYAVMGFGGIWLGIGTSMFAAIAIGLGIDFSIHTLDRMKELITDRRGSYDERLADLFPSTGRALFFNFAALTFGFLVLSSSDVPPLIRFGLLVAVAVSASFAASMTILPAIGKLVRPAFLFPGDEIAGPRTRASAVATAGSVVALAIVVSVLFVNFASADEIADLASGDDIVARVNARDDGQQVTRALKMELIDRRGKSRVRETMGYRRYYGEEKRTVLFYRSPANVKGTGFLTYDYPEAEKDDDQWLYLPALRKVRRISASDRGDYFLGTDFTYEDIKKETRIAAEDYTFARLGSEEVDGHLTLLVEGIPVDVATAEELGYGRVLWRIDPETWISRKTEMWDVNGNLLKTLRNEIIEDVQGIWTSLRLTAVNHKTGHSTIFTFADVDYRTAVDDSMFEQRALRRGR
ncbi:MAG: outer membrane lipoprotein-sorting protein [Gammaproteobacteria bacterium]|nr:outer membrane lipoprotein-sorting protein [Gammaproteobacteria bacterium]